MNWKSFQRFTLHHDLSLWSERETVKTVAAYWEPGAQPKWFQQVTGGAEPRLTSGGIADVGVAHRALSSGVAALLSLATDYETRLRGPDATAFTLLTALSCEGS